MNVESGRLNDCGFTARNVVFSDVDFFFYSAFIHSAFIF